jgi:peptide/nickel transport system substrate-binding protein
MHCIAAALVIASVAACGHSSSSAPGENDRHITVSVRSEPRTLNPFIATDYASALIPHLIHAKLLRVNRRTWRLEPQLAESWALVDTERSIWRMALRPNVRWSDGAPFGAADVVFSVAALLAEPTSSVRREFITGGNPVQVRRIDDATIEWTFPTPFTRGLKLLDSLPVLPAHVLAVPDRSMESLGNTSAFSSQVGLGPYRAVSYRPGQDMRFEKNTHYWKSDMPYPEALTLKIVPDQNAEIVRLIAGELDFIDDGIRPEDVAALRPLVADQKISLHDVGPSLDTPALWFNLRPDTAGPRWWQVREFRHAVSRAVDRTAFVDAVYFGMAVPTTVLVTPAYGEWYFDGAPAEEFDAVEAKRLLASLQLHDRNDDGFVEDADLRNIEFSLLVPVSNRSLVRGAQFIRDSLSRIGIQVSIVELEVGSLVARILQGDYDAVYYTWNRSDPDPESAMEFWRSSGSFHVWHPNQPSPATAWELKLDTLAEELSHADEETARHRLFAEMQRVLRDEMPIICFATPNVIVPVSTRLSETRAGRTRPHLLWSPESLQLRLPVGR